MLDKTYNFADNDSRIYEAWEKGGYFSPPSPQSPKPSPEPSPEPYTIVIPPPNITGNLHIGHALNNVIQDVLIRYHRLQGKATLWQPGTDHASIATQMVVERRLKEAGEPSRHELGREKFLQKIWQWKEQSGGSITHQLRRLGSSCDWSRERFTMDEGLSQAVLLCFVQLYNEGLIYRDKRLVNWDPVMETAISDLEVVPTDTKGSLWHFRYPLESGEGTITVATTRPETMLGDTAIAVHPEDERYKSLVGKYAIQPLTERKLLIVADEYADPQQGTGAVKITPAHDFNDFEVGKRHNLPVINIMTLQAAMNDNVPEAYRGLDRFEARKAVIRDMQALGLFDKQEDHEYVVPYGDRGGVPIEPLLTDQWFLDAETLAKPAIKAVKDGNITFVPHNWQRTYFDWMENIQPWCISRQLWWGHQIPAWYGEDNEIFVAMSEAEAYTAARQHYGKDDVTLHRDPDVLDTWFSSALWPFSTLGWPEKAAMLAKHYPTDVLVTAFDIIFFWVARMIMFGLHFMKTEPFATVYVHALVRDAKGQKMSKSKGNVIDPLDVVEEYGCDAMRWTLASLAAPGRDIKLSKEKLAVGRNFMTKIWNAARFCEMNGCEFDKDFDIKNCTEDGNRWIIRKVAEAEEVIRKAIISYRFHDAAGGLYHFIWGDFCDSYLEIIKPILYGDDVTLKEETQKCAAWVLRQILLLLHPVTPFISEALWREFHPQDGMLIAAQWPDYDDLRDGDSDSYECIEWGLRVIGEVRSARARLQIAAGLQLPVKIINLPKDKTHWLQRLSPMLEKMARVKDVEIADDVTGDAIRIAIDETIVAIPAGDIIDISAERKRLQASLSKQSAEVQQFQNKLNNENFTAKAPPQIVAEVQEKLTKAEAHLQTLQSAYSMLAEGEPL